MDSTLITIECIDEIADMQGIKPQVAAITERSMRGELDFSASLRERVSLLAGLPESALEKVYQERLQLSPGAEQLLARCKENGIRFMLVSGGFTFFTERLKQQLGLDYAYANQLEVMDGKLTGRVVGDIVDAAAKQRLLIEKRSELGLRPIRSSPWVTVPTTC
jgi:phosphoserine phosphatase